MKASIKSNRVRRSTLSFRTLIASLLVVAFCFAAIPAWAGGAEDKAKKAFADWKAAQQGVAAAQEKLAEAQKALQNAMTAVAKSGGKTTPEQEAALAKGRANVAAAEAALREAERQELLARVALESAIAELPDGELKDQLKRERNFPSRVTANGLHIIRFDMEMAQLIVNLPDDMRAGDTISGTVTAELKGKTPEERANSVGRLKGYVLEIGGQPIEPFNVICKEKADPPCPVTFFLYHADQKRLDTPVAVKTREGTEVAKTWLPPLPPVQDDPAPARTPQSPAHDFTLPPLGQQGRPIVINGPFDGNASNTVLGFGPERSTIQDFEKKPETVVGGYGPIRPLAESPRKIIFESPTNFTGPVQLMVKEGDVKTLAPYRNVGVNLSAPKTSLLRGERTTVTVEVRGLEGIKKDVPLQLDSKGVITMEGGNSQSLRIAPGEVKQGGTYTATRTITGQQSGAFTVTATVVVRP